MDADIVDLEREPATGSPVDLIAGTNANRRHPRAN